MEVLYYDEAIVNKLKKWIPDDRQLRVLNPNESARLFELAAEDSKDAPLKLPLIALSRNPDIKLLSNIKQLKSFNGLNLKNTYESPLNSGSSIQMNVIPITVEYQLDIYTKTAYEADEYVRNFIFKLLNNPQIIVEVPYNNMSVKHTANLRVLDTISDTSDIPQKIFSGQFYRWTIPLELQDGFLFSVPVRPNYTIQAVDIDVADNNFENYDTEHVCSIPNISN